MVDRQEQAALLLALRGCGRDPAALLRAVRTAGSALPFVNARNLGELDSVSAEIECWEREGIGLLTVLDERYPTGLAAVHQRPPFLTYRGTLDAQDERSVAVVGGRKATPRGLARARDVAAVLADAGWTVTSGLGVGVDAAVHRGALDAGARTVAVVGTGLRHSYPVQNCRLEAEIARTGAVFSQFLPGTPPARHQFAKRSAVMSGLSVATVVVEADEYCPVRVQAEFALSQRRHVFFAREVLRVEWAAAMAELPGVTVLDGPDHLVHSLARLRLHILAAVPERLAS